MEKQFGEKGFYSHIKEFYFGYEAQDEVMAKILGEAKETPIVDEMIEKLKPIELQTKSTYSSLIVVYMKRDSTGEVDQNLNGLIKTFQGIMSSKVALQIEWQKKIAQNIIYQID